MKWIPFMSIFVLEKMCKIIKIGFGTDKGFKEVQLTALAKVHLKHCAGNVSST
jgi:hypothetical protein